MGKVFIETYVIRFEDQDNHHITLKTSDDLKIAIRQHEKAESPYLKLVLERAGKKKTTVFGFKKKKKAGDEGDGGPQLDRKSSWFRSKKGRDDDDDLE